METKTGKALDELIATLTEVRTRWASDEWNLRNEMEVSLAHRTMMHMLEGALVGNMEADPAYPRMAEMFTPDRKYIGDNPDGIYYDAAISPEHEYVIRGKMKGAVYVSITLEEGMEDGAMSTKTLAVLNDKDFDITDDGSFTLYVGGPEKPRNWMAIPAGASRVTTRHYFEDVVPAGANPAKSPEWVIERVSPAPTRPYPSDESIAAGIARVSNFVRSRTLGRPPFGQGGTPPSFVSFQPNTFPQPATPEDFGWAAADAHYCMAPYFVGEGQALVITGRWPTCRMANLVLWNRFMQAYDYANEQISLNRTQTKLEADGTFRIVIAHEDPGVPNWINTQGEMFGLAFWRFMLAEGDVEAPVAELVELADLKA